MHTTPPEERNTSTRPLNTKKYLFSGLLLFAVSMTCEMLFSRHDMKLPLEGQLSSLPLWALLLLAVIQAPVTEEFAFRSWQKPGGGRRWAAPILFVLYAVFSLNYVMAGFALLFVVAYWFYHERIHPRYIIIVTTFVFALMHLPEDYHSLSFYFTLSAYLGLALIFTFVRLRYGLGRAMLVHGLWNFTVLFLLSVEYFHFTSTTYDLSTATEKIVLKRHSVFDWELNNSHFNRCRIEIPYGNKQDLISSFTYNNDQALLLFETNPFTHYELNVRPAADSGELDYDRVWNRIIPELQVAFDSSYSREEGFELRMTAAVADTGNKKRSPLSHEYTGSVKGFASMLQERYGVPFFTRDTAFISVVYDNNLSLESQLRDMQSRYGFRFGKTRKQMLKVVVSDK